MTKRGLTLEQMIRALKLQDQKVICLKCAFESSDFLCISCGHVADPACWPETNEGYDGPYCEICVDLLRKPGIYPKRSCPFSSESGR